MDFIEQRLFDELRLTGTSGGPRWSTTVTAMKSGREQRQVEWSKQRASYDVGGRLVDQAELEQIVAHFNATQGRALGFRWRDIADHRATRVQSLLKPLGDGFRYQLHKLYAFGGVVRERKIVKPVAEAFELWLGGAPYGAYTLDTTTGIVSLHPLVTSGISGLSGLVITVTAGFYDAVAVGNTIYINGTAATVVEKQTLNRLLISGGPVLAFGQTVNLYPQSPALEASFIFDIPVRFDTDDLNYTYLGGVPGDEAFDLASLPVVELKP